MNNVSGLDELIVYPVPVKDVVYISVGTYAMKKMKFVELLSMDGRSVLYSNNAIENDFELTVRGVAAGCYYLKVAFGDGSVACKKIAITE